MSRSLQRTPTAHHFDELSRDGHRQHRTTSRPAYPNGKPAHNTTLHPNRKDKNQDSTMSPPETYSPREYQPTRPSSSEPLQQTVPQVSQGPAPNSQDWTARMPCPPL